MPDIKKVGGMMRKLVVVILAMSVLPGCASMFRGTEETIQLRSEEVDTRFFAGTREIGRGTIAIVSLPKSGLSDVVLRAEKKDCFPKTSNVQTGFDPMCLLGIYPGLGVPILIDWINGATHKAVQKDYILTPECMPTAAPKNAAL